MLIAGILTACIVTAAFQEPPDYPYMRRPPMSQPAPAISGADVRAFARSNRLSPDQAIIIESLHDEYLETLTLVHEADESTSDWLASISPVNYSVFEDRGTRALLFNLSLRQLLARMGMTRAAEDQFLDDLLVVVPEHADDIAMLRYTAAHRHLMRRSVFTGRFARLRCLLTNVPMVLASARPTPEEREKARAILTPFLERAAEVQREVLWNLEIFWFDIHIVVNLVNPARAAGNEREAQRHEEESWSMSLRQEALAMELVELNQTVLRELSAVLSDETAARFALVVESTLFPGVTDLHNLAVLLNDALLNADPAARPALEALRDRYAGELARTTSGLRSAHQRIMARDSLRELYQKILWGGEIMPVNEPMAVFREIEARWTAEAEAMHAELERIKQESR